jgi:hypothetical protein
MPTELLSPVRPKPLPCTSLTIHRALPHIQKGSLPLFTVAHNLTSNVLRHVFPLLGNGSHTTSKELRFLHYPVNNKELQTNSVALVRERTI